MTTIHVTNRKNTGRPTGAPRFRAKFDCAAVAALGDDIAITRSYMRDLLGCRSPQTVDKLVQRKQISPPSYFLMDGKPIWLASRLKEVAADAA